MHIRQVSAARGRCRREWGQGNKGGGPVRTLARVGGEAGEGSGARARREGQGSGDRRALRAGARAQMESFTLLCSFIFCFVLFPF